MAVRTTPRLVSQLVDTEGDGSVDLSPFITTANALVNAVLSEAGYTETYMELIERWLSAHFYAVRERRVIYEAAGSIQARYEGKVDLGLQVTEYGQQAMILDYSGTLAALNENKGKGMISWLGTPC